MTKKVTNIPASKVRALKLQPADVQNYQDLARLGICFDAHDIQAMAQAAARNGSAMDADLTAPVGTTASIATPVQFLQTFLPGFVETITQARKIDSLIGMSIQGRWEDEEVVQGILEKTGNAAPYGDHTNVPLASWNVNFERRTVVRFEEGFQVNRLEEARSAAMRVNSPEQKRQAAALALEIQRNLVGFNGYNSGANRTYGILNDPNLPAYVNVPNGTGGNPEWSTKTFLEICADIRVGLSALRSQSGDLVDPSSTPIVLTVATSSRDFMSTTSDFGISVSQWLKEAYPNVRVESVSEFDGANGGSNVFYLFAESVEDGASDDSRTFIQVVPTKFQMLGVEQSAKGYTEDFSNATSGTLLKRPYAVYRGSDI